MASNGKYGAKRDATERPFRIWDATEKKNVRYRNYANKVNAHDGALRLVRWEKVGRSLEVYDIRTARHLGTYTRGATDIAIWTPASEEKEVRQLVMEARKS